MPKAKRVRQHWLAKLPATAAQLRKLRDLARRCYPHVPQCLADLLNARNATDAELAVVVDVMHKTVSR